MEQLRTLITNLHLNRSLNNHNRIKSLVNNKFNTPLKNSYSYNSIFENKPINCFRTPLKYYPKLRNNQSTIDKNNRYNNGINYVAKNINYVKEQEYLIKQLKAKQLVDKYKILLNYNKMKLQNAKNFNFQSKLFDYEDKHKKLIKKYKITREEEKVDNSPYKYYKTIAKSLKIPIIKTPTKELQDDLDKTPLFHKDYGSVPYYLENRKREYQMKKEYDKLLSSQKKIPRGYRIISENERLARIDELIRMKIELEDELFKMPIALLSKRQIDRKGEIQRCLYEIDEKMNKLHGYKEVIMKIDED
jgi:hypothetical protein